MRMHSQTTRHGNRACLPTPTWKYDVSSRSSGCGMNVAFCLDRFDQSMPWGVSLRVCVRARVFAPATVSAGTGKERWRDGESVCLRA
jgi:hypothetical protein